MCLLKEFIASVGGVSPLTNKYFQSALGIPKDVLTGPGAALLGRAKIQLYDGGFYEPNPDGTDALIVPCGYRGPYGISWDEVFDLVAFHPREPGKWYRRSGVARFLGQDNLDRAAQRGEMLAVYETPLSWLRSGAQGVCIVDWRGAVGLDLPILLAIVCENVALGKRLDAALQFPQRRAPEIRVMNQDVRHAA